MDTTHKFLVNVSFYNSPYHNEYFIDEKSANEYADRMRQHEDAKAIELLCHGRNGYRRVWMIIRHHKGAGLWLDKTA